MHGVDAGGGAAVQEEGAHQRLEAVGHGMLELAVVAGVAAVGVEHVVVEAADEYGEVLVLDHDGSEGGMDALLQFGEHVAQVDQGDELHHRVFLCWYLFRIVKFQEGYWKLFQTLPSISRLQPNRKGDTCTIWWRRM